MHQLTKEQQEHCVRQVIAHLQTAQTFAVQLTHHDGRFRGLKGEIEAALWRARLKLTALESTVAP
jgi:hypothetical protein